MFSIGKMNGSAKWRGATANSLQGCVLYGTQHTGKRRGHATMALGTKTLQTVTQRVSITILTVSIANIIAEGTTSNTLHPGATLP